MSHPRRRHYRVAQKAVEEQVTQREDDQRRSSVLTIMLLIVLITQLLSLAVQIYELFDCGETESY